MLSTGIERALGRHVDHAINHDARRPRRMHRINSAQTVHHCEDVFDVDPKTLDASRQDPSASAWFSPDCKHFSKAKGGKPLNKKIRGLAFVILRWAKIHTRVIYMENVEEIETLGTAPRLMASPIPAHKGRTWKAFKGRALQTASPPIHPDMAEILDVLGDTVNRAELLNAVSVTTCRRVNSVPATTARPPSANASSSSPAATAIPSIGPNPRTRKLAQQKPTEATME